MKHNRPALTGIFAVRVHGLRAQPLPGAASLGVRPTVTNIPQPRLEVHLLDFDRNIYGAHLQIDFLHKFRDEEKYADVETLMRAIAIDVQNTRGYFTELARNPLAKNG
jgi:riboflavin kinase / FMN adenylyltransferase